jgi:hypothetical protein
MRTSRALVSVTSLALAATSVLASSTLPAQAAPGTPTQQTSTQGRGAGTAASVDPISKAQVIRAAAKATVAGDPIEMPTSYPQQPTLRLYRDNADDAAHTAALLGHPDLAPRLMDLMAKSDRISVQVVGQSTEGRDLYLVTLTAPETAQETAQQAAWKAEIKGNPTAAAADSALLAGYKTPVWLSNNIHGNEWEGTDAALQYIEYLATAPMTEVGSILANNRVYFSPSLNPDGRTNATRATALGLDPNRDIITNSTPETRSFIRTVQAIQPIYSADFHGYTNVLQVEPCGPPHGSNYEYDLYMPHNYALALKVEKDVVDAAIPGNTYRNVVTGAITTENISADTAHIKIPYRDTPSGWDDFPPVFSAQYAAFYGAVTSTVELPLTRGANNGSRQSPDRAAVNKAVAFQTMKSIVGYMNVATNASEMLKNQIEVFRRGEAGKAKTTLTQANVASVPGPTQWQPLWDVADDQEPVSLPRAYVIPVGKGQRSVSDAARLVRQLITHNIEVGTLDADATVGGVTYPKGSSVVDLHQPLRGLANSLLDLGEDISAKVPSMYDISAWSYSYTWGATVAKVGSTTDAALGGTTPITAPAANASVPAKPDYLAFDVAGVADFRALNALLEESVPVSMLEDGTAVVSPEGYDEAAAAATGYDIEFEPATDGELDALDDESTKGLTDLTIGYVGTQDDKLSLGELGFDDVVPVSAASVTANPAVLDGLDLLWVGSSFAFTTAQEAGKAAVQTWVDAGHSITGRTHQAFNAASAFGLVSGTVVNGNSPGNGIVDVDTPADSVLAPYEEDTSFIYPAYWFTDLGEGVKVEQSYDAEDPFLAGHWRPSGVGVNGPANAAGQASAVSASKPSGAKAFVFGTSVFFRTHTKALMSQAARAIFWAAPSGTEVVAPGESAVTVAPVAPVTYPRAAMVNVAVSVGEGAGSEGTVDLLRGDEVLTSAEVVDGAATLKVPGLEPGATSVVARFTSASPTVKSSTSEPVTITVRKAVSRLRLAVKELPTKLRGDAKVTLRLTAAGLDPTGTVVLTDGKNKRIVKLDAAGDRVLNLRFARGRHTVRATYGGSSLLTASKAVTRFTIR